MGLFSLSEMSYELDRDKSDEGQPSLSEMVDVAVRRLKRNKDKGFLLVVGDLISGISSGPSMPALLVDPVTLVAQSVAVPNYWHGNSSLVLLSNDQVLISGVMGCEIYDPAANTFTVTGSMNTARNYHNTYLMPGGDVIACAGSTNPLNPLSGIINDYEVYSFAAGTWSTGLSNGVSRAIGTRFFEMNSGDYLIIGGESEVLELYDPFTNTLTNVGSTGFLVTEALAKDLEPSS